MSNKKSSELSREEEERAQLDAMMGDAFGGVEEIQVKESEQTADTPTPDDEDASKEKSNPQLPLDSDDEEKSEDVSEEESSPVTKEAPSLPPSSPPTGPPSGPPGGPPSSPPPSGPSAMMGRQERRSGPHRSNCPTRRRSGIPVTARDR